MDFLPEEFDEILNIFRGETEEIIQKLNNNLLQLETNPHDKELLVYLFRDAHSLKGAARMIGFNNIQRLAHKIEDVLGLAKENKIYINHSISDALYKSTDLLSDLIQQSVKIKKEHYTDEIQLQIDKINALITESEILVKETPQNDVKQPTFIKNYKKNNTTTEIIQKVPTINALLSEAYLLLDRMNDDSVSYIETFYDTVVQLKAYFDLTSYFDIKNQIDSIVAKTDFVINNSKIMTKDEIIEINERLEDIVNYLNEIYLEFGIDKFDYKGLATEKNKSKIVKEKEEKTTSDNSALRIFVEKIEFLKEGITDLDKNLTQIPDLQVALSEIVQLSKKQEIEDLIYKIEEILNILKKTNILPEKEIVSILKQSLSSLEKIAFDSNGEIEDITLVLQRLDIIKQMLDLNTAVNPLSQISSTLNESSLPVKKAQDFFNSFESTSIRTLRVDSKKLDALVNQIGEIIIARIKQKKNVSELEKVLSEINELRTFNNKSQSFIKYYDRKYLNSTNLISYDALSLFSKQVFSILQENSFRIQKIITKILNIQKSIDEEDTKQSLIINQLESMIKNVRVLPLATIFHMFPRMIRDISKDTGKEIELLISGSETSADKKVIEEIKAPLIHIIRNSIDHGIETPEERIMAGKSPKGKIYIIAKSLQTKILIEIHDDGRGIDLKKILKRALEKNLITQKEADCLSDEQIMNIIFWPGFSTEQTVTEISGRGVGLDIVQTKISQLNGNVRIFSIAGQGTKITIELPVSMSTMKAFIVESAGQLFAMSMNAIKNVMWVEQKDIYVRNSTKTIIVDNKNVNLYYLNDLMKLPSVSEPNYEKNTVVLVEIENNLMGIAVDKILGDQDILQKKLDAPIIKLKNISGITTLASGEICLILNLVDLYKSTYKTIEHTFVNTKDSITKKTNSEYKILIVDDSLTTRELLKSILSQQGYSFELVKNPREAFEILYKKNFDLILSDMEMPEMDGGMFVRELKANKQFRDIPVVIISSYHTDEIARNIPDAAAVIKKSNFCQTTLLNTINKLLKS